MKKLLDTFRRSFSARLSLWVVSFTALVFLAAMAYFFVVSRHFVREEAILRATQVVENSVLRLNNILEDVVLSADNLEWLVYRHLDEPETMMEYSRSTVQSNPVLSGCSISFEPDYFPGHHYYSAYSGYVGGTLQTEQEGDEDYQYFYLDWYLQPKLLNQPCWTEPYSDWDQDDAEDRQTQRMVSYCKPLTTSDGYIGGLSLDISLKWLSDNLSSVKPYPHAYSILISRGGTYLVHPDPDKLFYQTIFTEGLITPKPDQDELGRSMLALEAGYRRLEIDGTRSYVFFTPLKATGWSMAIVCPESDIFGRFNRLGGLVMTIHRPSEEYAARRTGHPVPFLRRHAVLPGHLYGRAAADDRQQGPHRTGTADRPEHPDGHDPAGVPALPGAEGHRPVCVHGARAGSGRRPV